MSEFGLEQVPALAGDDYLGYEDDDYDGEDGVAGYYDEEYDDAEIEYDGADLDGVEGEPEVGRFRRGPRRRMVRRRRVPRGMRRRRAPRRVRRAPSGGKKVIKVKDDILILSATASAAGAVSDSITVQDDFFPTGITFDGSSAGAAINSLQFHKTSVLGPFSGTRTLPADSFKSTAYKMLSLKGTHLRQGQQITLNGTIAGADHTLKCVIHGKSRVFGACN